MALLTRGVLLALTLGACTHAPPPPPAPLPTISPRLQQTPQGLYRPHVCELVSLPADTVTCWVGPQRPVRFPKPIIT